MSFLAEPGPRWFNIEAGRPFLEDLARGLTEALGVDGLAGAIVLLPTRRAGRDLAEAFLAISSTGAMLLPQVRALGDLDEGEPPFEPGDLALDLPAAITAPRRRYELARLAAEHEDALGRKLDAAGALDLADALAAFLDSVQLEEADPLDKLDGLAPEELARHWQVSADFLRLALTEWPARLEAMGVVDPSARRVALLQALAERWREAPPQAPVIAAGSTGSAPAVARLLAAVAELPRGAVVLPGLDLNLADAAWDEVADQHPQGNLKRLLDRAGVARADVRPWHADAGIRGRWRRRLINEALRPADRTADWLDQIKALRAESADGDPIAAGLEGLSVITARAEEEAATCAALLLREALETPGRTAALVTPDVALARRVSARLTRWGVSADSSAGAPLAGYTIATLMALAARAAFDPLDPVTLLGLAKHRLVRAGFGEGALGGGRFWLERALRGARPSDWAEIEATLARLTSSPGGGRLLAALRAFTELVAAPFAGGPAPPSRAAAALAEGIEQLARDERGRLGELWSGLAGEAAAALLAGLIDESEGLPDVSPAGFIELIDQLLGRESVRGGGASHPRLRILGAIEARLVKADLLVLAGLEEGVWPQPPPTDPFLSRPMRTALGLPPPERRLGLAAHDFAQGASAPEVVLLAAERRDGAPTVASRWLWRLRTLVEGAGLTLPERADILAAARALDAPAVTSPAPRPYPKPPVAARPKQLPVTGVETWIRDPYATYARYILRLRKLDRPAEPVEALARGTAVHRAFERFAAAHPLELPVGAHTVFADLLIECLADAGVPRPRLARETALARNVAPWVVNFEERRRPGAELLIERTGTLSFETEGGEAFTVTAKADRIERRGDVADVIDFKTGAPPSRPQVQSGLAPQLTLTAAILRAGGFADIGPVEPGALLYVRVSGGRVPGREDFRGVAPESGDLASRALAGLKLRVARFYEPTTPYVSWAAPQFIGRYGGDYDHLARYWEWGVIAGEDEL